MDYIYNYAFLWISLITRTKRFFTVTKKKKNSRVPSIVQRDELESTGEREKKKKRNDHHRL